MVRILFAKGDDEVPLLAVAVDNGKEDGRLLVADLGVHQTADEGPGIFVGGLALEGRPTGTLGSTRFVAEVGLEGGEGLCFVAASKDLHGEPLFVLLFLREDGNALGHAARPQALEEGQGALRVQEDWEDLDGTAGRRRATLRRISRPRE